MWPFDSVDNGGALQARENRIAGSNVLWNRENFEHKTNKLFPPQHVAIQSCANGLFLTAGGGDHATAVGLKENDGSSRQIWFIELFHY